MLIRKLNLCMIVSMTWTKLRNQRKCFKKCFFENELAKKDEIIKTLLETQTSNLETVSEQKNRGNTMTENHYLVKKKKKKPKKTPQKPYLLEVLDLI